MAYSVFGDVRARCDTDITDAEITSIIEEVDAWLDLKLTMASLTVPMRRLLSATQTAILCFLKDPNEQALGEYREDRAEALLKLNKTMDELMKDVKGSLGTGIAMSYGYVLLPYG